MTLRTDMTEALDSLFDDQAESITYNGQAINAIVDIGGTDTENAGQKLAGTVEVKISDIAAPVYRAEIVINGVTWRGIHPLRQDWQTWVQQIETDVRPDHKR